MTRISRTVTLAVACVLAFAAVALAATVNGGPGPDFLVGTNGNDTINGQGGRDNIFGLNGNDKLNGGNETGPGDNIYGDGSCPPGAKNANYCDANGGSGNDTIDPGDGDDSVVAGAGNDKILASNGNDTLQGNAGNDIMSGGNGNDTMTGGNGNDKLDGGAGNDTLGGGAGKNSYKGGAGKDSLSARNGVKEIVDCGSGSKDKATVDRSDTVKGCESVKRPKK